MTSKFKKDYKTSLKRGCNPALLQAVIAALADGQALAPHYRDHALGGNFQGYRECHIQPDWLLIYKVHEDLLVLALTRTGSHSDLF